MKKTGLILVLSAFFALAPATAHAIAVGDMFMVMIKAMRYTTEVERVTNYLLDMEKHLEELAKENEYLGPIIKEIPAMKALGGDINKLVKDVNGTKRFFEDFKDNGFIPKEYRDLVAFPTDVSKQILAQAGQKSKDMTLEGVMFRAFETKEEAQEYVKNTFFIESDQKITTARAESVNQKRLQLQKEVNAENYAYAQAVKTDGQEDFVKRMEQLAEENKPKESPAKGASEGEAKKPGVASEAKAWAVNTLALRNVVQETMVRVVLEQRLLEQEAVSTMCNQPLVLIKDPAETKKSKEK